MIYNPTQPAMTKFQELGHHFLAQIFMLDENLSEHMLSETSQSANICGCD